MSRACTALAIVSALLAVATPARAQDACDLDPDCATVPAAGVQTCAFDLRRTIDRAANDALGADGPGLPPIRRGCAGGVEVAGRVPCQLLRAFAWARSGWRQFCATGCGADSRGPTRFGALCGIGLTQVPEDEPAGAVDLARAAASTTYNAGAGARRLAEAWGRTPCVGNADPDVAEHWYFAVWAADVYSYANNPNNPAYPVLRGVYGDTSSLDRDSYPFQEVVFGLAGHPPSDEGEGLWEPSPVTLPATLDVCGTAGCMPTDIEAPSQTHARDCPPFVPPTDGGVPDAGTDDAGAEDGGSDAGNIVPDPRRTACGCRLVGARVPGEGTAVGAVLGLVAVLGTRMRRRQVLRSGPARRSR